MRTLEVYLEISGEQRHVGYISGNDYNDACFCYDADYISSEYGSPISISLPLTEDSFSEEKTKCFFEGLLPEGFSRRAVANWIKADENDYLTILSALGRECLGAIKIVEEDISEDDSAYKKLTLKEVKKLAEEGATKSTQFLLNTHLSLAGATGKVGLYYDENKCKWYLPEGNAPSTHIVKQSHVRLEHIVLNEQLCMLTAKASGLDVAESFIINTGDGKDSEILFATRRYDRLLNSGRYIDGLQVPNRLHQEDFAQAMGVPSSEKYETIRGDYLKRMFETIRANCSDPIADQIKLWKMICFNYLIGNTDSHIKNFALLYDKNLKNISLAPAYDIVSTKVYNLSDEMSFFIGNGLSIEKLTWKDFADAAGECGLTERMARKAFDEVADYFEKSLKNSAEELYAAGFRDARELKNRILNLKRKIV